MNPLLQGLFMLGCCAAYADYQAGLDAYVHGDYEVAMAEWKAVASGQPAREELASYRESLYGIAMLYWQGEGVERDYSVSAVWLKQAADINHPGAQTKLGYLYSTGQGVPQNYGEAVRYFQLAAGQGDPDAKYNLDMLYNQGLIPEPGTAAAVPEPVPGTDYGEAWILSRNAEHYTIQVIALSAPDKLQSFIAGNPEWAPFAIYRQTRYEKPLWVLVQGDYPDVESARASAASFPGGLQRNHELWIRKFGMVQRLIE